MRNALLVVLVCLFTWAGAVCTGCGAEAVPGGTAYISLTRPDGTRVTFKNNKDTSLESLEADVATGKITLKGLNSNGSNLGNLQMQWSIVESNNRAAVLGQMIGAIRELAPMFGGGGILGGIGGGGGTAIGTTGGDTPAQATQRASILATIAACPFLAAVPDQQAYFTALVAKTPGSGLNAVQAIVDRLKGLPVAVIP